MAIRSSTSSSEPSRGGLPDGFPRAGALAVAAILLIDRLVFGAALPWERIAARIPESHMAESGVARDQRALARLGRDGDARPRVFVVGSSRAETGFQPEWLPPAELPPARLVELAHPGLRPFELAHPGLRPFELRSLTEEILAHDPSVVVLLLSEFETSHPLDLKAPLSAGSFSALADLLRAGGVRFALERRTELYRLAAVGLLDGYRFRTVLRSAGLDALREFPLDARLRRGDDALAWLVAPGERSRIPAPLRRRLFAEIERHLPQEGHFPARVEMRQIYSLSRGAHVSIQESLLRRTVERLRGAGCRVVLVEAPLFPGAAPLYDAGLREEFAAFARDLARETGVRFVPLDGAEFRRSEFRDLTHLNRAGAEKLTRRVLSAVREELGPG